MLDQREILARHIIAASCSTPTRFALSSRAGWDERAEGYEKFFAAVSEHIAGPASTPATEA